MPEELTEQEEQTTEQEPRISDDTANELTAAYKTFATAQAKADEAKARAKMAKANEEAAQAALNAIIRQIIDGPGPLFTAAEAEPSEADEPELWRGVKLAGDDFLPPGILKALAENSTPITTLGELTDWQAEHGDFWAKDIPGIGEAAQEKIDEALMGWWKNNPEMNPEQPAADITLDTLLAAGRAEAANIIGRMTDYDEVLGLFDRAEGGWLEDLLSERLDAMSEPTETPAASEAPASA